MPVSGDGCETKFFTVGRLAEPSPGTLDILGEPICRGLAGRGNPERIAITQPRVARNELPWVGPTKLPSTLKGLNPRTGRPIIPPWPNPAKIVVHTVFSTKERRPFLRDKALRDQMHRYLGRHSAPSGMPARHLGGVEDHVHFLCALSRTSHAAAMVTMSSVNFCRDTNWNLTNGYV